MHCPQVDQDGVDKIGAFLADDAGDDLGPAQLQTWACLGKVQQGAQRFVFFFDLTQGLQLCLQLASAALEHSQLLVQRAHLEHALDQLAERCCEPGRAQLGRHGQLRQEILDRLQVAGKLQRQQKQRCQRQQPDSYPYITDRARSSFRATHRKQQCL